MSDCPNTDAPSGRAASATVSVSGLATSRGFAVGPVFLYSKTSALSVPEYILSDADVAAELSRYRAALAETRRQIEELAAKLKSDADGIATDVLANHLLLLEDPVAISAVERRIRDEHLNAEAAIRRTTDDFRAMFAKMKDEYLRERQRDVEDIESRMMRILLGCGDSTFEHVTSPVIVVADDLTPSETVTFPRELILGFATNRGSATSHAALLARALGIPAVVGLGDITSRVQAGDIIQLDGSTGVVTVNPDAQTRAAFDRHAKSEQELLARIERMTWTQGEPPCRPCGCVRTCSRACRSKTFLHTVRRA